VFKLDSGDEVTDFLLTQSQRPGLRFLFEEGVHRRCRGSLSGPVRSPQAALPPGLFGEEAPGRWSSYGETIARNAVIVAQSKGFGLWRRIPGANRLRTSWGSWYDFHAALATKS
jgi:hypothetical protein